MLRERQVAAAGLGDIVKDALGEKLVALGFQLGRIEGRCRGHQIEPGGAGLIDRPEQ